MFVRRNAWSGGVWSSDLEWYATAVEAMQALPPDDPVGWQYQAAIHGTSGGTTPAGAPWRTCQHQTWFFLPWHRWYLLWFERIVRHHVVAAGGPADWALPYWDYGTATQRALPPAFREPDRPDGSANPLYVAKRRATINAGAAMPAGDADASTALGKWWFTSGLFVTGFGGGETGFNHGGGSESGALELQPHNIVHVRVGGTGGLMTNPNTAALDPIFWLHHANIDRLWEVWRSGQTKDPYPSAAKFRAQSFRFVDESGAAQDVDVADALVLADLDYTYDSLGAVLAAAGPGADMSDDTEPSTPVPSTSAGMVGRADDSMVVTVDGAEVTVPVGPPPPTDDGVSESGDPTRWFLELADVDGPVNPGVVYEVHLYAVGDDGDRTANLVGLVSFFGIETADQEGHPLSYTFDVTDVMARLRAGGTVDRVEVALVPQDEDPSVTTEDAAAEADALAEAPTVRVGTVALHAGS